MYPLKKFLLFPLALLILGIGVVIGQMQPRFEHVYGERVSDSSMTDYFEVFHDRDTGNEIICIGPIRNEAGQSCFLSGRS